MFIEGAKPFRVVQKTRTPAKTMNKSPTKKHNKSVSSTKTPMPDLNPEQASGPKEVNLY